MKKTPQESIDKIIELRNKKYTYKKIAKEVGASLSTCQAICRKSRDKVSYWPTEIKKGINFNKKLKEAFDKKEEKPMLVDDKDTVIRQLQGRIKTLENNEKHYKFDKAELYRQNGRLEAEVNILRERSKWQDEMILKIINHSQNKMFTYKRDK